MSLRLFEIIAALIAGADLLVAASGGPRLAPDLVRKALASGTVPVCSQRTSRSIGTARR